MRDSRGSRIDVSRPRTQTIRQRGFAGLRACVYTVNTVNTVNTDVHCGLGSELRVMGCLSLWHGQRANHLSLQEPFFTSVKEHVHGC
jgi:hypothetical protein